MWKLLLLHRFVPFIFCSYYYNYYYYFFPTCMCFICIYSWNYLSVQLFMISIIFLVKFQAICRRGGDWFSSFGRPRNTGTKVNQWEMQTVVRSKYSELLDVNWDDIHNGILIYWTLDFSKWTELTPKHLFPPLSQHFSFNSDFSNYMYMIFQTNIHFPWRLK